MTWLVNRVETQQQPVNDVAFEKKSNYLGFP